MIFPVRTEEITNAEIDRQIPTPKCNITINPVVFKRDAVKPVQTPVVQDPIDIPSTEPVFIGGSDPSLQERFRERFGGIRARFQGRVGTHRIEDFLINRPRRFQ
ncbi:MAG: hypothetical protein IIC67_07025 [Thaumarchaeota archaeon]|nr:hypothetical protein [Nitrososphaerota archaeon]